MQVTEQTPSILSYLVLQAFHSEDISGIGVVTSNSKQKDRMQSSRLLAFKPAAASKWNKNQTLQA